MMNFFDYDAYFQEQLVDPAFEDPDSGRQTQRGRDPRDLPDQSLYNQEPLEHNGRSRHQGAGKSCASSFTNGAFQNVALNRKPDLSDIDSADAEGDEEDHVRDLIEMAHVKYFSGDLLGDMRMCLPASIYLQQDLDYLPGVDLLEPKAGADTPRHIRQEKWDIGPDAIEFLATIVKENKTASTRGLPRGLRPCLHDLRLEEPLLHTDPEADIKAILRRNEVHLNARGIKPFKLNKEKDESLRWPSKLLKMAGKVRREIADEKWAVYSEVGTYMKNILQCPEGNLEDWLVQERKRKVIRKLSPVLLPLSPPFSPEKLRSTVADIPLTDTPEDPSIREAAELAISLGERDEAMLRKENEDEDTNIPEVFGVTGGLSSSSPLQRKRRRLHEAKISSPLLDQEWSSPEPPAKKSKTVSFNDEIATLIPKLRSDSWSTDPEEAAEKSMAAVVEMLRPHAGIAVQDPKDEGLVEIDTVLRVSVPPVDDSLPLSPWQGQAGVASDLLKPARATVIKTEKRWSGASKLECMLPWSPFPSHLGKVKPEIEFDDGSCARYLTELQLEDKFDIRGLTWKPDGLRILDAGGSDEDCLEGVESTDADTDHGDGNFNNGMRAQMHKSLAEMAAPIRQSAHDSGRNSFQATKKSTTLQQPILMEPQQAKPSIRDLLQMRSMQLEKQKQSLDTLSARNAVTEDDAVKTSPTYTTQVNHFNRFLALQGQAVIVPEKQLPAKKKLSTVGETTADQSVTHFDPAAMPSQKPKVNLPAPRVDSDRVMPPVIVSAAIMGNHHLVRKLQAHLPALDFIVRDPVKTSPQGADDSVPLLEADITISPSTGLMSTTVQKLKQRPLPGQNAFFGVGERVQAIAVRYERLIVLVSEGRPAIAGEDIVLQTLDERDTDALAALIGLTAHIECDVHVQYVPGGEETLAHWLAACVARYVGGGGPAFPLLPEETFWERLLRQAGLNAYAAQAVLDQVKVADVDTKTASSSTTPLSGVAQTAVSGLAAIVLTSVEERVRRFGPLLGGDRVLRRVSSVIDARWQSASSLT